MTLGVLIRLLVCILFWGVMLCLYIDKQNDLTWFRIEVPQLMKNLSVIEGEVSQLRYEVEQVENPEKLMELARSPEFSHLKHPSIDDVVVIHEE